MRLTKHRQEILNVLKKSHGALSASAISKVLPQINLVTIYRGLEYFVNAGLIKKLNFGEQGSQYEIQEEPHHHAICHDCDRVIHFTLDDNKIKKALALTDFKIEELEITVRGTCLKKHATS